MITEYKEKIRLFLVVGYIIFAVGTAAGALYYVNCRTSMGDIKNMLDLYVESVKAGLDTKNIVINTLKDNMTLALVMFICAFFRAGMLLLAFTVIRKGFITGFTVASIAGGYGIKGLWLVGVSVFQYIIIIPVMLMFFAVNMLYSTRILQFQKKNLIFYILFLTIVLSIFSIESFLEGIFSTTFMKWLLNKIT